MSDARQVQGVRMHGAGNRVLLIDADALDGVDPSDIAVGSGMAFDSLLVLEQREDDVTGVRVFNRDGSDGGVCGNGMRCVAALRCPHGGETSIESDIGRHRARVEAKDEGQWLVTLDMPPATLGAAAIGLAPQADAQGHLQVDLGDGLVTLWPVSTGNPHLIYLVDDTPTPALVDAVGPAAQQLRPGGVNLHLVKVLASKSIALLPIERGVGPTAACATGAQAAVTAMHAHGLCEADVDVHMPGGLLRVQLGDPTHVTGAAAIDRSQQG